MSDSRVAVNGMALATESGLRGASARARSAMVSRLWPVLARLCAGLLVVVMAPLLAVLALAVAVAAAGGGGRIDVAQEAAAGPTGESAA